MADWKKKILKIGLGVGGAVAPGAASEILKIVGASLDDEDDPANAKATTAIAEEVDALGQAVLKLHERLEKAERELKQIKENK